MNIREKLLEKFKNWNKIDLYLDLINSNLSNTKISGQTENHHILPKSIFPEFSDLRKYKWNSVHLKYQDHFMAHYYLSFTGDYKMLAGLRAMAQMNSDRYENPELIASLYAEKKEECILNQSKHMKEKLSNPKLIAQMSKAAKATMERSDIKEKHHKALLEAMKRPEVLENLRRAHNTPEVRAKKSAAAKIAQNNPITAKKREESFKRNSRAKRTKLFGMYDIITGELIKTFDYVPDACEYLGIKGTSSINKCLQNKINHTSGYNWNYIE